MIMKKQEKSTAKVRHEIMERCGQDVNACIQCGKCTAGCPVVSAMDLLPREIMLHLQQGTEDNVVDSKTPWICASCFTCAARCPRELDLARIMEAVRVKILRPRGATVLNLQELSREVLQELPQQALVSGFRKYSR